MRSLIINLVFVLLLILGVAEGKWSYDYAKDRDTVLETGHLGTLTPHDWYKLEPSCNGDLQSPVDIEFGKTKYDSDVGHIEIHKLSDRQDGIESWKMLNNGKTVEFTPISNSFKFMMYPQREVFHLEQMHFHWRGSEHYVDDKKFAGEIHLVFTSDTNAKQYSVIGYLIDMVTDDNANMKPIIDELYKIRKFNASSLLQGVFKLQDIVPFKINDFFRYSGSLTTPGCNEIVEWNLVESPVLSLSENQILELQGLKDKYSNSILSNARPIQSLNDRIVIRSFKPFYSELRKASEASHDFITEASHNYYETPNHASLSSGGVNVANASKLLSFASKLLCFALVILFFGNFNLY